MSDLTYKFVSELDEAQYLSANDLFLVSQVERTPGEIHNSTVDVDGEYKSKYLKYSKLCAVITKDVDDKISSSISSSLEYLSTQISSSFDMISAISADQKQHLSAIIKMANCIQVNKTGLSILSNVINAVSGVNGIRVERPSVNGWTIGHSNYLQALSAFKLVKIKYDKYGHITGKADVVSSDLEHILSDAIAISGAVNGIEVNSNRQVSLLTASNDTVGGVKVDNSLSLENNIMIGEDGMLSSIDTTYGVANGITPGLVKVNGSEFSGKNYPVKISNDFAYVNVPWTDSASAAGTYKIETDSPTQMISSLCVVNGAITYAGKSTYLYDKISSISSDIYQLNIPKLSAKYLGDNGNVSLSVKNNMLSLLLSTNMIAKVDLGSLQSKELSNVEYTTLKEESGTSYSGYFLKFTFTDNSTPIYCDVEALKDTFVQSAWYDVGTKRLKLSFNDSTRDVIEIPLSGIMGSYFEPEEWEFTLSDDTKVTKQILIGKQ